MRHASVVIDNTHGLTHFPHLAMQVRSAASKIRAEPHSILSGNTLTIPPRTTKLISTFVDHPSEWNKTGTLTPLERLPETASLLTSHSISTMNDNRLAVRVTNSTELPYLIKKNTQIAEFFVLTPEQSIFIKPVDTAILSNILEGDHLTSHLSELLRIKNHKSRNNTFWSPPPQNPGKTENHKPIQTRLPRE